MLEVVETGGEAGIRTLGTAIQPYNGLANRRLQPLGHLSVEATLQRRSRPQADCPSASILSVLENKRLRQSMSMLAEALICLSPQRYQLIDVCGHPGIKLGAGCDFQADEGWPSFVVE